MAPVTRYCLLFFCDTGGNATPGRIGTSSPELGVPALSSDIDLKDIVRVYDISDLDVRLLNGMKSERILCFTAVK